MIRARKQGFISALTGHYVERKVRRAFRGIWSRGFPSSSLSPSPGPQLIYCHHTNFWDGLILHQVARQQKWDAYCLMEERNLLRYPFLSRIGAFSIRRGEASSSFESLRYAKQLLSSRAASVIIFPEGSFQPFGHVAPVLGRGLEVLARMTGVWCLPIAIRYCFFESEIPSVLVEAGPSHRPSPIGEYRRRLESVVEPLKNANSTEGFELLVAGRRDTAERWDRVRGLT